MHSVVRRFTTVAAAVLFMSGLIASTATAAAPTWSHRDVNVCGPAAAGSAACDSVARVLFQNGQQFVARSPQDLSRIAKPAASVSYTAVGIRTAYSIPTSDVGSPKDVIAIVDAYDNPNAYSHLATYRNTMGINTQYPMSSCGLSGLNGTTRCFVKLDQTGGTSYPRSNSGWATEIDLDLQAASAICPSCSILLVEANSSSFNDLGAAVSTAAGVSGVLAISNSYSSNGDVPGTSYPWWDQAADAGIAVMASTGDSGYGVGFPASAKNVLGVGGTTLNVDSNGTRTPTSETAWSGSGSGCSTYNPGTWQFPSGGKYGTNPCGSMKAIADLSADADPYSGLQIYTTYNHQTGWWIFGGTSLSSPLMGAFYAMQGGYNATTPAAQYAWESTTPYYDVTSGSNGSCSPSVLCNAGTGWDGPTGLGSIQMAAAGPVATSISVTPADQSVPAGGTQTYTAQELDQYGSPMKTQPTFSWSVSGVGSFSATGPQTATVEAGDALGSFTVTASTTDGAKPGSASGTVVPASILVAPGGQNVTAGSQLPFIAAAYDVSGAKLSAQPTFSWSVSPSTAGAIDSSGSFTSGNGSTLGAFTVTASYGGVSGQASDNVVPYSITVSPDGQSVPAGGTQQFTATANDTSNAALSSQPAQTAYSWSATSGAITVAGLFTADPNAAAGSSYAVTATWPTYPAANGSATGTVTLATPGDFSISASPGSRSVKSGASTSYAITISRTNFTGSIGFVVNGAPSGSVFTWQNNPTTDTGTSAAMTVSTTRGTAKGTYTLTITGASGTVSHSTTVSLKIR
jgi:hypothetical protein